MNHKGFEFSFAWIFALFVGIAIISLAVYTATQLVDTSSREYNTKVAAQLGVILNPVETNLETSKTYPLVFPDETRLRNICNVEGTFGLQQLQVSVRNSFGKTWNDAGTPASFSNKYIFSQETVQGQAFYLIVQPVNLPYKIGDMIIVIDKDYCFVQPPEDVASDIASWNVPLISTSQTKTGCKKDSISVCFSGTGCNVSVSQNSDLSGKVTLQRKNLDYYGPLLYSAIFSDPDIYNCQLTRLRKRANELASVYIGKTNALSAQGCSSNMASELQAYSAHLKDNRIALSSLVVESEQLSNQNEKLICPLF